MTRRRSAREGLRRPVARGRGGGRAPSRRKREAAGLLLAALGLFLAVSFVPDPSGRENLVGPLGAASFALLARLFSWGGLLLPVLAVVWGVVLFRGRGRGGALRFTAVASAGTLGCLSALALLRPEAGKAGEPVGGLVAERLGAALQGSFGQAGGLIALGALVLLLLMLCVDARPAPAGGRLSVAASAALRLGRALVWTLGLLVSAALWLVSWIWGLLGVLGVALGAAAMRLRDGLAPAPRSGAVSPAGTGSPGASSPPGAGVVWERPPAPRGSREGTPLGPQGAGVGRVAADAGAATAVAPASGTGRAPVEPRGAAGPAASAAPPAGRGHEEPEPAWEVTLDLFDLPAPRDVVASERELQETGRVLIRKLADFNVHGEVVRISSGPVITQFEVEPAPGVKVNQIANLADDLALAMRAQRIRIVAPIPGKGAVGIEIPNARPERVTIRELLASAAFTGFGGTLPIVLGKEISGTPVVADLARMPHLLIAGSTGSGKSVCINGLLTSLLVRFSPADLRLILIDPKMLELSMYNDVPHLLHPVVTRARDSATALKWTVYEMERRFELLAQNAVRNIADFNARLRAGAALRGVDSALGTADEPPRPLPYVVAVVDELADLMLTVQAEVEEPLARLAQKARAVGIHVVLATQRPSVNVLTGFIKANFPSRISFQVASKTDSRTILDQNGAEALLGQGDMLFLPADRAVPIRIQGAYVSGRETEALVGCVRRLGEARQFRERETIDLSRVEGAEGEGAGGERDELFFDAARVVIEHDQGSSSLLQRRLKVGYSRAARIVDQLHEHGVLGPPDGSKPREVRIGLEELARMEAAAGRGTPPPPRSRNPT